MTGPESAELVEQDLEPASGDDAKLSLLSAGGTFQQYPGPVLVVGGNGVVLSANASAEPITQLLQSGATVELHDAINAALAGKAAQIAPLFTDTEGHAGGVGHAWDLVALPWAEGAAALLLGRDITLERSLRGALIDSRQRYKDLVEISSDFVWETDTEGRFAFVSPRGALGYAAAELVGQHARNFLMERDLPKVSPFTARMPVDRVEVWFRAADGKAACLSATALPLSGPDGAWCGARGTCRDITEERAREAALARARHRQHLLAYILKMVRDELEPARMLVAAAEALVPALPALGVSIYCRSGEGTLEDTARAGARPPEALIQSALARVGAGDDSVETHDGGGQLLVRALRYHSECNGALCLWRAVGDEAWGAEEAVLVDEIVAQISVTNERLVREQELKKRSSTDPLTGLLNRRGFLEQVERHLTGPGARSHPAALFYIDLDNFKPVNDRHGHPAGDRALEALAELLREQMRSGDLAARLGGDEFGLFFKEMPASGVEKKARALLNAAVKLVDYSAGPDTPLGLSVGAAIFDPRSDEDTESLIERADAAMYAVKRGGKGGFQLAGARADGRPAP